MPIVFRGEANDPDGDTLAYTWKFGLFDKLKDSTPAIKRTFKNAGDKKVTLIASDGEKEITKTWNIKVVDKPTTPAEKIIQYGGKTYKLTLAAPGESLKANEKLIEYDGEAYKLTVV